MSPKFHELYANCCQIFLKVVGILLLAPSMQFVSLFFPFVRPLLVFWVECCFVEVVLFATVLFVVFFGFQEFWNSGILILKTSFDQNWSLQNQTPWIPEFQNPIIPKFRMLEFWNTGILEIVILKEAFDENLFLQNQHFLNSRITEFRNVVFRNSGNLDSGNCDFEEGFRP